MLYYPTAYEQKRTGYRFLQWVPSQRIYHTGTDWNNGYGNQDKGQPVVACTWGVVLYASPVAYNGGLGGYIVIHHPHNGPVTTRYMHLGSITVKEGETVYPQQLIGTLSDTGNAAGAHLHFEVLNHKGLQYITKSSRPYGRYSNGLSRAQVAALWMDPEKWLQEQNHYVGPSPQQKLNQVENALRWSVPPRKNMLERLKMRLQSLLTSERII